MSAIPTTDRTPASGAAFRPRLVRSIALAGLFAALTALMPMASALADDERPTPSAPIMRSADRGAPMVGTGSVRQATQMPDAHGIYVGVQGGDASAGQPIAISDGNHPTMPRIAGENGVICSTGQNVHSAMIPCFG